MKRKACSVMLDGASVTKDSSSIAGRCQAWVGLQSYLRRRDMAVMGGVRPFGVAGRDGLDHLAVLLVGGQHGVAEHQASGTIEPQLLDERQVLGGEHAVAGALDDVF